MFKIFVKDALCVKNPSQKLCLMVCIPLCLCLNFLGLTFPWTLFWGCLEQEMEKILFLWLLTGFQRWHILFHAKRWMMLVTLLIYSLKKWCAFMAYQEA